MSLEDRREALVQATIPLLLVHGANVTTNQIAKAADVAEGTVFRAFKDKQELLGCALKSAMEPDTEIGLIDRIPATDPIEQRLIGGVRAVTGYLDRMWSLMSALRDTGFDPHDGEGHKQERKGPPEGMLQVMGRIAGLFEPDAERLRVEPELAARLLMGIVFTNRMQQQGFGEGVAEPEQLVELFLHGTIRNGGDK
ncbi:TetR family transcriptional regulator [Umezawaea tangerina]|uniref:TetR family transcriptional regulator n=2 Tax=Umezawaea tangerina TaxID=84725 RepID=A0A2T0SSD3_9PSEU|nr:TetR family transcriptional regulator [Umezawaea tangerina]